MIALKIAEDNRILSACVVIPNGKYDGMPKVEYLPSGETQQEQDITNYLYVNGKYIYSPKPIPEPVEPAAVPTVWDELDAAYQEGVDSV